MLSLLEYWTSFNAWFQLTLMSPGDHRKCCRWHALNVCHEMLSMRRECDNNLLIACKVRSVAGAVSVCQHSVFSEAAPTLYDKKIMGIHPPPNPSLLRSHNSNMPPPCYLPGHPASIYIAIVLRCNLPNKNRLLFFRVAQQLVESDFPLDWT